MIKLSELQLKEIIVVNSGKRLGYIFDLEIDPDRGFIIALIVAERGAKGTMFKKTEERLIYWEQIATIGSDVILVNDGQNPNDFLRN
ncbi:YlmC/YmxH family sporulation protein [Virgibacillus sp. W0181]|uniref:YlmC/YmxH family sporulation protein n=1 Tax=Virgibacillus sp. W0181 TaxID=3391581 RepID=UPI003F48CA52